MHGILTKHDLQFPAGAITSAVDGEFAAHVPSDESRVGLRPVRPDTRYDELLKSLWSRQLMAHEVAEAASNLGEG